MSTLKKEEILLDEEIIEGPRPYPTRLVFLLNMSVFFLEGLVLWLVLASGIAMTWFILLHFVVVGCMIGWYWWVRRKYSPLFPLFSVAFVSALGPLGALGIAYAVMVHAYFRRNAVPFEEWYEMLFPQEETDRTRDLYNELMRMDTMFSPEERRVDPLMDVILYGTYEQKQAAIVLMANKFIPAFAPVLKKAVNDPNNAIRVLAATALSKIETQFVDLSMELESNLAQDDCAANHLALARHYDGHAFSGLLESIQEKTFQEKALGFYRGYLEREPGDTRIITTVGRLLVRNEQNETAAQWFKDHEAKAVTEPNFLMWYTEVLFAKGDIDNVRRLMEQHGNILYDAPDCPPTVADAARLWREAS